MTPDRSSKTTSEQSSSSTLDSSATTRLSRRWSSLATNLLATGVILIGGLTFGRQVLHWWSADAPQTVDIAKQVVGDIDASGNPLNHVFQFGNSRTEMFCESVVGRVDKALEILRRKTRQVVVTTEPNPEMPGPAVSRWLSRVTEKDLVDSKAGQWQIFQQAYPVPIVVGVRFLPEKQESSSDQKVAGMNRRVVCWSLAFPRGSVDDSDAVEWSLFTFVDGQGTPTSERLSVPLPARVNRTLSVGTNGESSLIGFRGDEEPKVAMEHFDDLAKESNWQAQNAWQQTEQNWRCCYTTPNKQTIHITLSTDDGATLNGLIMIVQPE